MIKRTTSLFFAVSLVLVLIMMESFNIAIRIPHNQSNPDTVILKVDLSAETGEMNPVWAWFGYDEPNYTFLNICPGFITFI